jgi:hypothetical protein
MSAPPLDQVVGVRGTVTPDELAALLAALAHRPAPVDNDRYEQWRRSRVVALARTSTRDPSRQPCQIRRPQLPRLSTDPAAAVRR